MILTTRATCCFAVDIPRLCTIALRVQGIAKVMEMAFDHVLNRVERPLHLSYDIDSVDPTFAPSTGTRVAGGLTYREAYYINETIAETGCLVSMDLAEVNPQLDEKGAQATVDMATGLIASALGNTIM